MANENCSPISIAFRPILLFGIAMLCFNNAKSKPKVLPDRTVIFNRAQSLNNGISVSWLE
jgi:hypothetical protein